MSDLDLGDVLGWAGWLAGIPLRILGPKICTTIAVTLGTFVWIVVADDGKTYSSALTAVQRDHILRVHGWTAAGLLVAAFGANLEVVSGSMWAHSAARISYDLRVGLLHRLPRPSGGHSGPNP